MVLTGNGGILMQIKKSEGLPMSCPMCDTKFKARDRRHKYCGKSCRDKANSSKEFNKTCMECGKAFKGSRFRECCSIRCTQIARFKNVETTKEKPKVQIPPPSKANERLDPQLSTERYFYSLVNTRNDVKLRKCLRCGRSFNTTPNRRTCAACSEINSKQRMRL